MTIKPSDNYAVRIVVIHSVITSFYVPLVLLVLMYYELLYDVGKFDCLLLPLAIMFVEVIKATITSVLQDRYIVKDVRSYKSQRNSSSNLQEFFRGLLIVIMMACIYYTCSVLLGALFLTEQEETLMFSILITCITILPASLNLGPNITLSMLINLKSFQGDLISEMILFNVQLALVGAWLGAVVIPLDWDRPWQVWPIPCSIGVLCGYAVANVITLMRVKPKITRLLSIKTGKYGL